MPSLSRLACASTATIRTAAASDHEFREFADITQDIIDAFPWILDYFQPDEEEDEQPSVDESNKNMLGGNQ
jgi:hypothetical protein